MHRKKIMLAAALSAMSLLAVAATVVPIQYLGFRAAAISSNLPPNQNLELWADDGVVTFTNPDTNNAVQIVGRTGTVRSHHKTGYLLNSLWLYGGQSVNIGAFNANRAVEVYPLLTRFNGAIQISGQDGPKWIAGEGHPEGRFAAPPGSVYSRTDTPQLCVKGGATQFGWVCW